MLAAIDLDDQASLAADEIHDIRPDWILPNEFRAADLPRAQPVPQPLLGIGCVATQAA
jgi:hypothetical protein